MKVRIIHCGRRRHQRVGRAARLGIERHHHRLQRAARPERRRGGRPREGGHPPPLRHLQRRRRDEEGDDRPARTDLQGSAHRLGGGPRDLQGAEIRHHRRLHGDRRAHHALGRRPGAAAPRQRRRLRREDRLAAPLQGRRVARSRRASSAASASRSTTTSRSATSSRSSSWSGSPRPCDAGRDATRPRASATRSVRNSQSCSRREVQDPGIGFLTITRVGVTPDLQQARVYYTTLGDEKARRESRRALERATPFLRRQIGRRLRLRRVPDLEFSSTNRSSSRTGSNASCRRSRPSARTPRAAGPVRPDAGIRCSDPETMTQSPTTTESPILRIRDAIRAAAAVPADLPRPAGRRRDRIAAGDGVRARRARQGRPDRQRRRRAGAATWTSPACAESRSPPARDRSDRDAVIVMECGDLARTGVAGPRRTPSSSTSITTPATRCTAPINWFDDRRAACGEMVFDVIARTRRRRSRSRSPRTSTWRSSPTPASFHYSNITPRTFDICRQSVEAGVEPGRHGAARVRQQQLREAEADRRGARRDGARRRRPARGALHGRADGSTPAAARTTTPRG